MIHYMYNICNTKWRYIRCFKLTTDLYFRQEGTLGTILIPAFVTSIFYTWKAPFQNITYGMALSIHSNYKYAFCQWLVTYFLIISVSWVWAWESYIICLHLKQSICMTQSLYRFNKWYIMHSYIPSISNHYTMYNKLNYSNLYKFS